MDQKTLRELLVEQVRDLYDAEKQIVRALPKLARGAKAEELGDALSRHLEETRTHVTRLEQVFEKLGIPAKGKPCTGMKGLLEEGAKALEEKDEGSPRDLAIIAGCQKVEHYEMSAYRTTRTLAGQLDEAEVVQLLGQTEAEEEKADEKLTEVASTLYRASGEQEALASLGSARTAAKPRRKSAGN